MSLSDGDPRIKHAQVIKNTRGLSLNPLITLYSKSNLNSYALRVFNSISSPDVVSWTAIISAFSNTSRSFHYLISMLRHSVLPNSRTFGTLFKTCASLSALPFALQLHSLAYKLSFSSDPFTGSALVSFYCKTRLINDARKVFDEMFQKDEVCFASIINGLAQNKKPFEALQYFSEMRKSGVGSTVQGISGALRAVSELAMFEQCRMIHGHAMVTGCDFNVIVGTALINAYGRCGLVAEAIGVFDKLEMVMNLVGWNAMLAAYAQLGDTYNVVKLFESMENRDLKPDEYTFLAILTAFCNAGLANETEQWLTKMTVEYQVEPGLEHYTCMIAALGKAGRLEEAENFALTMPFKPDAAVWRTLLSACCSSTGSEKLDMAYRMSERLLEINPNDDSAFVISANVSAAAGRWDEVKEKWKMMKERNVRKEGGRSWIELQGEVHEFIAGDGKHERKEEIYAKLAELLEEIEKLGYVPVWDEMLHEVDEKEKKEVLWGHSEKLALAFGVLSGAAPPGKAIRIVKNLRICKDCHEAFKYFSIVVEREILVRDVNRYHRFLNGSCSCGDFW